MASQVILKKSSVAARVPVAADLAYGELALNYTDGKLYYKTNTDAIAVLNAGSTGTVTSVGGTGTVSGLSLSGTVTTSGNLTLGGTLAVTASNFASQTANTVLAAPNGSAGVPTFRLLTAADIPSHNHTSLTGVTSIGFAAEASDVASISTTISSSSTFFDFNLTDDNNNDEWRWRFTPTGGTVYNAMRLVPVNNTTSNLIVSGSVSAAGTTLTGNTGTVTSVAALTFGTTGTDVSSTVATGTTTPVITLNIPTASATNRGALSSADWTTFNNKQPAGSYLTAESDTLSTVTGRGATTATASSFTGGLTASGATAITLSNATANYITTGTDVNTFIQTRASSTASTGALSLFTGDSTFATGSAGSISLYPGAGSTATGANLSLLGGNVTAATSAGGYVHIRGGTALTTATTAGTGGNVYIVGGYAYAASGTKIGGSVWIDGGLPFQAGSNTAGNVNIGTGNASFNSTTTGTAAVNIGTSAITTTINGTVKLPNVGTSGFVKLGAGGQLSADTSTYLTTAVTSVSGTGTVSGLSLSGTVTTTGNLTLGGTLSTPVSTINDSTTIGQNLVKLTNPSAITFLRVNADNTASALNAADFRTAIGAGTSSTTGTVTSVAALTFGTTGTDVSSTVANGTTTPVITLNIPTASATNRGALSAADWTTFNSKQPAGSYLTGTKVDSIAATSPILTSAATGAITLSHATSGVTAGTYNNVTVNTTGHVTSASNVSYLTSYTESDTLASVTARGNTATSHLIIPSGEGNALGFWGSSNSYSIAMGVTAGTYQYGPVTDYSIKMSVGDGAGRGFTWGQTGAKPIAALNSTTGNMQIAGSFYAASKSFLIDHPTKEGKKLLHGSLEGPEHGVYVRGKLTGNNTIELPEYWTKLVNPDSITVNLTPIGKHQNLFVEDIADNKVVVGNSNLFGKDINCFYVVYGERVDIAKLEVEAD